MVGTRDAIKFYDKFGYKPTKSLVCYKRGDALETKYNIVLSDTRGLRKVKRAVKMALGADAGR